MWIVKGIFLGLGLFVVGSLAYVINKMRPFEEHKATGISVITGATIHNPWFWIGLAVSVLVGCLIAGSWHPSARST